MRVLAIRGRNLASLEGEFSIDFTEEPLASAGIFAISGPTGAGKSTLLDAMCLALFSRTPRTELAKENNVRLRDVQEDVLPQSDPRFLLRRGTASGYAEVDFVALNGCRYRARWSVSRAREKESGRLQAARLTLYNIDAGKEEPGTNKDLQARIIELIGLTFDQFTRSVLLAQNDFSTFLKAEQGEKASLLEKLTGTEQYSEISRRIFAKNAEAKEAYEQLYARVQDIELLSEEEVEASQIRLSALEGELARLEKARAERQSLREAVKAAEVQIASKEKQREENARFLERALASLETSRKEYEQGEVRLARTDEESKGLRLELQQARKLDVQLESALKARSEADERMKDFSRRKQEAEEKLRKVEERQKKASEEWDKLTSWRERYRSKEGIAEQLSALLIHLDTCLTARRAVERSDKALLAIRQKIQRLEVRRQSLRREAETHAKEQVKIEEERKSVALALKELEPEALDRSIETCRTERERLLLEQAQFVTTGDIKSLRDKLTAGTPCPVCGSLEHPFASHEAHERLLALADRISEATLRLKRLLDRKERQEACGKQLAALQQKELELHKQLAADENARTELRNQLQSLSEQIDREELDKREQQEKLSQSLSAANALFGNDAWQTGWNKDPESFRETLTDFARQWQANGERLRELERERSAHQAERESYEAFLPPLRKQYEDAAKAYDEKNQSYTRLRSERNLLLGGQPADQVERTFHERVEALKSHLKQLQESTTRHAGEVEQYRGITEQIKKDLAETSGLLSARRQELDNWMVAYQENSEGKTLEESLSEMTAQKSECSFRLRTHEENKRKIAGFQQELSERRAMSERWAKLNELAGSADGAKFRRIAQGYTLDVLLSYANVQLRQLSRRYRLERVPDTLALQVIDQDMCDEIRTVHSLSGGESFLVSLALALGLSSLSSNRMKVESLFIDEGFGSLDAETLRVAMDALESLRTQGRKICVISHVQEMTERIPVQIRVNRAGNGRSYLEVI